MKKIKNCKTFKLLTEKESKAIKGGQCCVSVDDLVIKPNGKSGKSGS